MAIRAGHKVTIEDMPGVYFHGYQTVIQSVPNIAFTPITFTNEIVDTHGGHSTSSNTSRYTPPISGYYKCSGVVAFAPFTGTTDFRTAQITKNGSPVDGNPQNNIRSLNHAGVVPMAWCEATIACNGTSDFIEIEGWHDRGSATNTAYTANSACSYLICEWVAPL